MSPKNVPIADRPVRLLAAFGCGLALCAGLCPAGAQSPSSPSLSASSLSGPAADLLAQAEDKVAGGDYAAAETLLGKVASDQGRTSAAGANASFLLMTAYGLDGRYEDAQREATALLAALPSGTTPDGWPGRPQVTGQQQVFAGAAQEDARLLALLASEHDPAAVLARQGQIAEHRLHLPEAVADYEKAFRLLATEPQAAQTVRLLVEQCFFTHAGSLPGVDYGARRKMISGWGNAVLEDPAALPARRQFALTQLAGAFVDAAPAPSAMDDADRVQELERLRKDVVALTKEPPGPGNCASLLSLGNVLRGQLHGLLFRLAQSPAVSTAQGAISRAVAAETAEDWAGAAAAYREAAKSVSPVGKAGVTLPLRQIAAQAERSIPLMAARAALAPLADLSAAPCAFLGVDHTVGSEWPGTLGTEGWALFALHGNDLCGGPRLLDRSFSYRVRSGDPADPARRWRNAVGYRSRPREDLPLADPALPGERATSFVDDHGEAYPRGAGPDLYVALTIPAGRHLLSVPLHFSDPSDAGARYGLYLLAGEAAGTPASQAALTASTSSPSASSVSASSPSASSPSASSPSASSAPRCLASLVVSVADAPGYLRASVQGPARYTLVVRRLGSFNTNLPAIFLDPDWRAAKPSPLSNDLTDAELQASGLAPSSTAEPVTDSGATTLAQIARQYAAGPSDWAGLQRQAARLAGDASLPPTQRVGAALIAWRAQERMPLGAGLVAPAFAQYLALRYALPGTTPAGLASASGREALLTQQRDALLSLATQLRADGRLAMAERSTDAAWNTQVQLTQFHTEAAPASDKSIPAGEKSVPVDNKYAQNDLFKQIWNAGVRPYLARHEAWLWQGETGPAPQRLALALDAGYAGARARVITQTLLSADPVSVFQLSISGLQLSSASVPEAPIDGPLTPGVPGPSPSASDVSSPPKQSSLSLPSLSPSSIGQSSLSPSSPDPLGLQLARIWVDQLASGLATPEATAATPVAMHVAAISHVPQRSQDLPSQDIQQPSDLIVYVAACQPLLPPAAPGRPRIVAGPQVSAGTQISAGLQGSAGTSAAPPQGQPPAQASLPASDASSPAFAPSAPASLLRADQMETLARALLNRDIFPTERRARDREQAVFLLRTICAQSPQYARLDQVNALLTMLMPAPHKVMITPVQSKATKQ